ncbi:uncharacterized protein NPIL_622031 [Nephila pilipes]|uniref:Uncharacterized protein n=1 Tax=Nephila pilipes TaxID=299642 RepID=A0A8X6R8J2_NEPPI|nr:uncharacterized protein NPIL_622031 [Nephila pilipes]
MISTWMYIAYGVIGGILATALLWLCLYCIGFTCRGIRKDSSASKWLSSMSDEEAADLSAGCGVWLCCVSLIVFLVGFAGTDAVIYFASLITEANPETRMLILYGTIGGIVSILLPRLFLCCIGFTCCGVRGDSCASSYHSDIGDVEAGSCFAMCQSAGTRGFPWFINLVLFLLGFAGTFGVLYFTTSGSEFDPTIRNTTLDWNSTSDYIHMYNFTTPLSLLTSDAR